MDIHKLPINCPWGSDYVATSLICRRNLERCMHVATKAVSFSQAATLIAILTAALLGGCHGSSTTVPSFVPPTATFTDVVTPGSLTVTFDSTGSKSADGNAATSTWTFGDQTLSTSTQALTG